MLAVVCIEPGKLALEDRDEPALASGMVKVKIRSIGICGTDFHIYEGSHPFLEYPRVMGHELSGEVVEVNGDSTLSIGDRVIVNPYLPCGKCIACRKEKPNCCSSIRVLGVHIDGGMTEFLNVPEGQLYPANDLTFAQAAMVEFLSIGAHGVRRGEIKSGDRVLVVGAGPIGLGAAIFAQIAGGSVAILDLNSARIAGAVSLVKGAKGFVLDSNTDAEIEQYTNGDMFDVVLDATGNKRAMESSIKYVAHGGTCVFISVVKDKITFDDPFFHAREMRIIGSRNATKQDFDTVISSIKNSMIPIDLLNTHTADLRDLPQKLPQWLGEQDVLIKAVVTLN
ncbi:MAG: zinc-binding alcohol dehydrogenase family protein [Cellvibrio sp.]|uniref:zinc-binding alcohol dehydrogenase family protein n=1 Tax=Cellvibrio sp. TaxID=1965322 RepID=UPI002718F2D7|nr:zinc-binding alcohol dehydrogenase family protein [Cellvibrio sp.]